MSYLAFFAYDLGPTKNLHLPVMESLKALGHYIIPVHGRRAWVEELLSVRPDALVISLSSEDRTSDLPLLTATRKYDISCIVVCETHHTWARPGVEKLIGHCKLLVASPKEVDEARAFGYNVVEYVACPPAWQQYPHLEPEPLVRADGEKLIFVSGVKNGADTDIVLKWCVDALAEQPFPCKLIGSMHPSENEYTVDHDRRLAILKRLGLDRFQIFSGNGDRLQTACDLVISPAACSNAVVAAFQRRPCVCPMDDHFIAINREKQVGRPYFFPVDPAIGACALCSPETLGSTIERLLTDDSFAAEQRQRQEAAYPLPDTKVPSADIIAEFILKNWI